MGFQSKWVKWAEHISSATNEACSCEKAKSIVSKLDGNTRHEALTIPIEFMPQHVMDKVIPTIDDRKQCIEVDSKRMNFWEVNQYEWGDSRLCSRDHKVYYRSLRVIGAAETIEIETGSHIMIENQDNPRTPFIARVDRFFEDTKKECDQKRVLVDWYLRIEDTQQIKKTSRLAERDEVFLYTGGAIPRNIDAEAIIWKCQVFDFKHRGKVIRKRKNDKLYYCRAQFDAKKGYTALSPIQTTRLDRPPPSQLVSNPICVPASQNKAKLPQKPNATLINMPISLIDTSSSSAASSPLSSLDDSTTDDDEPALKVPKKRARPWRGIEIKPKKLPSIPSVKSNMMVKRVEIEDDEPLAITCNQQASTSSSSCIKPMHPTSIQPIKSAPVHAAIFLRGVVAAFRHSGLKEATIEEVIKYTTAFAQVKGIEPTPTCADLTHQAVWLESCGFILIDNIHSGIHAKVRLNISPGDILLALNKQ